MNGIPLEVEFLDIIWLFSFNWFYIFVMIVDKEPNNVDPENRETENNNNISTYFILLLEAIPSSLTYLLCLEYLYHDNSNKLFSKQELNF